MPAEIIIKDDGNGVDYQLIGNTHTLIGLLKTALLRVEQVEINDIKKHIEKEGK